MSAPLCLALTPSECGNVTEFPLKINTKWRRHGQNGFITTVTSEMWSFSAIKLAINVSDLNHSQRSSRGLKPISQTFSKKNTHLFVSGLSNSRIPSSSFLSTKPLHRTRSSKFHFTHPAERSRFSVGALVNHWCGLDQTHSGAYLHGQLIKSLYEEKKVRLPKKKMCCWKNVKKIKTALWN